MENSKPNRNTNKKMQERRLKVFAKSFPRGVRYSMLAYLVWFPEIRIQGKWVQECGFNIDDNVTVTVKKNMIVIKKVDSL